MAGVSLTPPTAGGGEVPMESELRESLSYLHVLSANEFENEEVDHAVALQTESDFYKGTPPTWLNFYLAERMGPDGGLPKGHREDIGLMKRDGYKRLRELVKNKQQGNWSVNIIKLLHEPGSGGSTLAMQVLWDLRKELRCAVLLDPNSDKKDNAKQVQKDTLLEAKTIAKQVIELFTAGSQGNQNTVLLLQDNERMRDPLQDCLIKEMNEQKLNAECPVAIILQCTRMKCITEDDNDNEGIQADVTLRTSLSDTERRCLVAKEERMKSSHGDELRRFHSFNIMLHNFHEEYVRRHLNSDEGKEITSYIQKNKSSRNTKLFAFMALLNSSVPGSYLLQSECESFLSQGEPLKPAFGLSFEDTMRPFNDLIVTFTKPGGQDKCVQMAHTLIAHWCVQVLAHAGVKRSTASLDFLQYLSRKQIPSSLLQFFRDMLTKREKTIEGQDKFSRVILEIEDCEDRPQCIYVLKNASETFKHDPIYPQALARFYYIRMSDFIRAEIWAEKAKETTPTNSFIADTLGQVHRYHLNSTKKKAGARDILFLAEKAIKAFKQEEELAEREPLSYMADASPIKMAYYFNNRGLFGYLQVASIIYDSLTNLNPNWGKILRQEISAEQLPALFEDRKLMKYKTLLSSLKTEVERQFYNFFDSYLTYSEPNNWRDQPPYFRREIMDCFQKYTSACNPKDDTPLQALKEKMASTFPGLLSCLSQDTKASDLDEIASLWRTIHEANPSNVKAACNYIMATIIQSKGTMASGERSTVADLRATLQRFMDEERTEPRTPEFYLLVLLLFWPENVKGQAATCSIDLNVYIEAMKHAFENRYKKYLHYRELVPLFYLGNGNGLRRLVHKSKIDTICEQLRKKSKKFSEKRGVGNVLKTTGIKDLVHVHGVVRDHKAYAHVAGKEIEIFPLRQASVWKNGHISFYLGFNISGPVAYDISYKPVYAAESKGMHHDKSTETKTKSEELGIPCSCKACDHIMDSSPWIQVQPLMSNEGGITTHRHMTPKGRYECEVSGLRWVCQSDVKLKYCFSNWEPHCAFLGAMQYTQGGPLLDITMESGELEEVHLPHFGCLGNDGNFKDGMRILHVEESGMSVEKVHEVTRFHAKLLHPTFSPKGVLLRYGLPLKVHCDLMVYLSKTEHLSLRIYLIPSDPALVEAVEKHEQTYGFKKIPVPRPEISLKMKSWFRLKTNCPATIEPDRIKLRYSNTTPSFFKVLMKDCNIDFEMELTCDNKKVWNTTISEVELRDMISSRTQPPPVILPAGFVKSHRAKLIQSTTNVLPIVEVLVSQSMIHEEEYSRIKATTFPQGQMRILLDSVIRQGPKVETAFVKALRDACPHLFEQLVTEF